jgi:hypothetical protein
MRNLDIHALKMRSVNMLVAQVYLEPQFHSSQAAFRSSVPALSETYRKPFFDSLPCAFHTLVVNTFEAHLLQSARNILIDQ